MTATLTAPAPPPAAAPGRTLGEVITWAASGAAVPYAALRAALADAGLDESAARQLLPRHAFARACKKLARQRIIRPVGETAAEIAFQFTQESKAGGRYEYTLETMLRLDKATGRVACELAGLATLAQEHLDAAVATRTGSDLTRLIQRLFERHADLFSVREKGGCYFVPRGHAGFVDRVEGFLTAVGGRLTRFPVTAGTAAGDRSVREAVAAGLAAMIAEHRAAVADFDADTRADALKRAAERVRVVRHKLAAYAEYLADARGRLERDLAEAADELRAKVAAAEPVA